jgi:hypothetical protein
MFVSGGSSPTGVLRVVHGLHSFPGVPGRSRDHMNTSTFEGDVDGVNAANITFNKTHFSITTDIVVPGSVARTHQLLNAEPTHNILGPYEATDANTRKNKCQMAAYTPFEIIEMVLGAKLTARKAYKLILTVMLDTGY